MAKVVLLNPQTCGIYKSGGPRYKTDQATGKRTAEIDNELLDDVNAYIAGKAPDGAASVDVSKVFANGILVPTYYDDRYSQPIRDLLKSEKLKGITLGELLDDGAITIHGGHGSPGNDQRRGHIPYIKVSDIRGLRVNINPTNLVSESVACRLWRRGRAKKGEVVTDSGLQAWDLITPNRASSNIGEFAILVPGEEQIVLTKEVFVFRLANTDLFDHFYLLWAFCLKAVREQWRRIALMQTNREDCGDRHLEIILPKPKDKAWATDASAAFRSYFTTLDKARNRFIDSVKSDKHEYIANVLAGVASVPIA